MDKVEYNYNQKYFPYVQHFLCNHGFLFVFLLNLWTEDQGSEKYSFLVFYACLHLLREWSRASSDIAGM